LQPTRPLPAPETPCPWPGFGPQVFDAKHVSFFRQARPHMPTIRIGNVHLHKFLQKKSFWKVAELQMYAGRYHLAELWTRSTRHLRPGMFRSKSAHVLFAAGEEVFRRRRSKCVLTARGQLTAHQNPDSGQKQYGRNRRCSEAPYVPLA
jgi:hypothetical protein